MKITIGKAALNHTSYQIDPTAHINIIGASGMGKSSTLENLFLAFIKQGHGGLFMDVHGDVADRLTLLAPKSRLRDFILFDPSADFVPPLNPLAFQDDELELIKEDCLTIFKSLSGSESAWGNETPQNFRNALDAITELEKAPTLVHLFRYFIDDEYRDELLARTENPFLKLFKKASDKLRTPEQASKLAPAINKTSKLMRPNILPIIGQTESIDPLEIMNGNKIMVCRISKGKLGEETAQILYSLIVSMFSIAALKREKQKERPPFMIVADEAQNGVHGGRFGTLLAEARKYGISLVTAFQGAYQMPIIKDILTNSATQIIFNASGDDAKLLSDNWHDQYVMPYDITALSRYEFYSRTFINNQPIVTKVKALPPIKVKRKSPDKIIRKSLERWATDKKKAIAKINTFLSN